MGIDAVATVGLAESVLTLIYAVAIGLAMATTAMVSRRIGEKDEKAASVAGMQAIYLGLGLVTLIFVAAAPWLVAIFTDDERITPLAEASLRIISYGYVFYAWGMVLTQAFNGAGDTTTPTWINLFCFWMLQIPLAWFLAGDAGFGPRGVFWAVAVAAAVIFRRGRWKTREV